MRFLYLLLGLCFLALASASRTHHLRVSGPATLPPPEINARPKRYAALLGGEDKLTETLNREKRSGHGFRSAVNTPTLPPPDIKERPKRDTNQQLGGEDKLTETLNREKRSGHGFRSVAGPTAPSKTPSKN